MKRHAIFLFMLLNIELIFSRSIHRTPSPSIPYIIVTSSHEHAENTKNAAVKINKLQNKYLRLKTLKKPFENSNFKKHMLPTGYIKYRKQDYVVHTDTLKHQNEQVLQEILQGKKKFTDFIKLADDDFNYTTKSGFIVLKYKKIPFVLKLFIEHPHTFIDPLNKGFKSSCLFVLNGNMRHLSGFTRIPNLETIRKALHKDPEYRYYLDFPRKWYWLPSSNPYLTIQWYDDYYKHKETIQIPGIYGIICDFIDVDKKIQQDEIHTLRQISIDVGSYLHNIIDSHVENFVPEKNSNKIVIIDTEHFPTMVGLHKEMNANGYFQWLFELTGKWCKTVFLRTKQERMQDQRAL